MLKTVSLETAKMLKENGFRQDTNFYYTVFPDGKFVVMDKVRSMAEKINIETAKECHTNEFERIYGEETRIYSAPTADDLLEELPSRLHPLGNFLSIIKQPNEYVVCYGNGEAKFIRNDSLFEALAQMWLYLKK